LTAEKIKIQKVNDYQWRIPREGKMRTDGIIYADERIMENIREDQSLSQVVNVAWLPGIVGHSLAMPDIHWGYGFPIGGVAAFDMKEGIVSPGGVGYDIN
jgi:tRNA-splicing ligase RtcB